MFESKDNWHQLILTFLGTNMHCIFIVFCCQTNGLLKNRIQLKIQSGMNDNKNDKKNALNYNCISSKQFVLNDLSCSVYAHFYGRIFSMHCNFQQSVSIVKWFEMIVLDRVMHGHTYCFVDIYDVAYTRNQYAYMFLF